MTVVSMSKLALLEPLEFGRDALEIAIEKATGIAQACNLPALSFVQEFHIDPLLQYGGGGRHPQWAWINPSNSSSEQIFAELKEADNRLNKEGYCGPDDRGAYFHYVLCLAWPDRVETVVIEGRVEGQLSSIGMSGRGNSQDVFSDHFIPVGESMVVCEISPEKQENYSGLHIALGALRDGLNS